MTASRVEEVAIDVANEIAKNFQGFSIVGVQRFEDAILITFCWEPSVFSNVMINPNDYETAESVRTEILRQIGEQS